MTGERTGPGTSLTQIEDQETVLHVYDGVPDYEDVVYSYC